MSLLNFVLDRDRVIIGPLVHQSSKGIPYSGKFSYGANFRIFRTYAQFAYEKKNYKNLLCKWPLTYMAWPTHWPPTHVKWRLCSTYSYFTVVLEWSDLHDPSGLLPYRSSLPCMTVPASRSPLHACGVEWVWPITLCAYSQAHTKFYSNGVLGYSYENLHQRNIPAIRYVSLFLDFWPT